MRNGRRSQNLIWHLQTASSIQAQFGQEDERPVKRQVTGQQAQVLQRIAGQSEGAVTARQVHRIHPHPG